MDIHEFMSLCSTQEITNDSDRYYEDLERDVIGKRIQDIENERYEQIKENLREDEESMNRYYARQEEYHNRLKCS